MRFSEQRRWLLGALGAICVSRAAASPPPPIRRQTPIWDLGRPPLVRLELVSPGPREVQRTLVGIYADERVCYLESVEVGSTALRFAAGSAALLAEQEQWAASVADAARQLPETQALLVIGHAEPIEAPTPALATALSKRRAEVARALLIAHGLPAARLQGLARGSEESALLRQELRQAAQWRRVSVQTADTPSQHSARLIHVRGDQRPLLAWMRAVQPAAAPPSGREPFEVGHHVPRFSVQLAAGVGESPGPAPASGEERPDDLRALSRLVGEMARSDCQIHQSVPARQE